MSEKKDGLRAKKDNPRAIDLPHTDSSAVVWTVTSAPRSDAEQAETEDAIRRRKQDLALLRLSVEEDPAPIEPELPQIPAVKSKRELMTEQKAEDRAHILSLEGLSEQEYCKARHDAGRKTPLSWQKTWKCPADYLVAFNLKQGRLRAKFLDALRHIERKNARRHGRPSSEK